MSLWTGQGGHSKAIKWLIIGMMILYVLAMKACSVAVRWQKNYTDLHDDTNYIRVVVDKILKEECSDGKK